MRALDPAMEGRRPELLSGLSRNRGVHLAVGALDVTLSRSGPPGALPPFKPYPPGKQDVTTVRIFQQPESAVRSCRRWAGDVRRAFGSWLCDENGCACLDYFAGAVRSTTPTTQPTLKRMSS